MVYRMNLWGVFDPLDNSIMCDEHGHAFIYDCRRLARAACRRVRLDDGKNYDVRRVDLRSIKGGR